MELIKSKIIDQINLLADESDINYFVYIVSGLLTELQMISTANRGE